MTNYERIKEMSIEELAMFICDNTKECGDCIGWNCCGSGIHANGLIKWMKKEVQTDGEE